MAERSSLMKSEPAPIAQIVKLTIEGGETMTLGQLREACESLGDDTPVYIADGRDHDQRERCRLLNRVFHCTSPRGMLVLF